MEEEAEKEIDATVVEDDDDDEEEDDVDLDDLDDATAATPSRAGESDLAKALQK